MAMKTTIKISLMAVMMAVMTLASCSSDEPADNKLTGEEMTEHIYSVMNEHSDNTYLNESMDHAAIVVSGKDEAHKICEDMLGEKWDGNDRTCNLPDNYGNFSIVNSSESGLFCNLSFNLNDSYPFTLSLCTKEYADNENNGLRGIWLCLHCKNLMTTPVWGEVDGKKRKVCNHCGSPEIQFNRLPPAL